LNFNRVRNGQTANESTWAFVWRLQVGDFSTPFYELFEYYCPVLLEDEEKGGRTVKKTDTTSSICFNSAAAQVSNFKRSVPSHRIAITIAVSLH